MPIRRLVTRAIADSTPAPATAAAAVPEPFGMFPPEVARALRERAVHRCWRDGEVVLPSDRVVPWILTVVQGKLRMAATLEDGREVFFRWHGPGEMAGMISAISDLPLPVDAVAYERCETLHVPREVLLEMMLGDGRVALAVARLNARHTYDTVNLLRMNHEASLQARVLGVLRHLAVVNGTRQAPGAMSLPVSQRDIAAALGASRQRVNAELKALEQAGHIRQGYNHVILLEPVAAPGPARSTH